MHDPTWFVGVGCYLARLTPVDLFPHTSHVEAVAVLVRQGRKAVEKTHAAPSLATTFLKTVTP